MKITTKCAQLKSIRARVQSILLLNLRLAEISQFAWDINTTSLIHAHPVRVRMAVYTEEKNLLSGRLSLPFLPHDVPMASEPFCVV